MAGDSMSVYVVLKHTYEDEETVRTNVAGVYFDEKKAQKEYEKIIRRFKRNGDILHQCDVCRFNNSARIRLDNGVVPYCDKGKPKIHDGSFSCNRMYAFWGKLETGSCSIEQSTIID